MRRGKGFAYYDVDGELLTDEKTLQRIKDLVIPPAWKKVWISPHPNGHIQAVGTDVAGRRQYLYHQAWQEERAEEKFDRVLDLSLQLPQWRNRIAEDLAGRGLRRDRVLALALHLLDRGYFRAGGEQYAEENESYGLATLQCEHVTLRNGSVLFDYPAKSGVRRTLEVEDPRVVRAVRSLLRRADRTERLLVCRTASGWVDIRADDLNARFKELVGDEYSVKDLRTWHGTVLAAEAFVDADPPVTEKVVKRVESAVMKEVAEGLGNTPAVARGSYVDPQGGQRLRAGVDHRRRGAPRRAHPQTRQCPGDPGKGDPNVDPQGRQELTAGFAGRAVGHCVVSAGTLEQRQEGRVMTTQPPTSEASLPQLLGQLSEQTSRLVRDELKLAQKEFQKSVRHAGIGAGLISVAGLLAVLGLMTVIAAAVAALSLVLPVWAAALIVAVVLFACAGVAALVSRKQVEQVSPPTAESVDSVKLDLEEIKEARHGQR